MSTTTDSYQEKLVGLETEEDNVHRLDLAGRVDRAVQLLKDNEPADGYYLGFSGGKDSCAIKRLAEMSGVNLLQRRNAVAHPLRYRPYQPPSLRRMVGDILSPPSLTERISRDIGDRTSYRKVYLDNLS